MSFVAKLKRGLKEYKRVLSIARKPTMDEFTAIMKICSLGVLIVGVVGFAIQFIYQFIIKAMI